MISNIYFNENNQNPFINIITDKGIISITIEEAEELWQALMLKCQEYRQLNNKQEDNQMHFNLARDIN